MNAYEKCKSIARASLAGKLTEEEYSAYFDRAFHGEDVYCYTNPLSEGWYLWDGEMVDPQTGYKGVRIPLPLKKDKAPCQNPATPSSLEDRSGTNPTEQTPNADA